MVKRILTTPTVILMLLSLGACASKQSTSTTTTDTTSTQGSDAATTADASPAADADGQGKIETTGTVSFAHDFKVPTCQIGKPGEGLLNGYTMAAEGADGDTNFIHVRIADFTKDGTYSIASKSGDAEVAQMMSPGSAGLQIMLATEKDQPPTALTATPQATTEIIISGDGAKGEAKFTKYQDLMKAQFEKDRDNSHLVDGSITWTCGKVDHLAAGTSDAVNGAFNSIMGGSKKP